MFTRYNKEFLREVIEILNISQAKLAKKLEVSTSNLSRILSHDENITKPFATKIIHNLRYVCGCVNAEIFLQPESKEKPRIVIENQIIIKEVKPMDKKTLDYFGLQHDPFRSPQIVHHSHLWLNHEFSYLLDRVLSTADNQEFMAIIGSVGSGKSNLLNKAKNDLMKKEKVRVSFIPPLAIRHIDDRTLLSRILKDIGEECPINQIDGRAEQLADTLTELEKQEIRIVIMIDDAHNLPTEGLQSLRILVESNNFISVVLFAQPRIYEILSTLQLQEVNERLSKENITSFRLKDADSASIRSYVTHKLKLAGAENCDIFEPEVLSRIGEISNTPLNVNNICRQAMIKAARIKSERVTLEILETLLNGMVQ